MATNPFINNFQSSQEQGLLENLIIESIRFYGHDVMYLPRRSDNRDQLYGADPQQYFDTAYEIEMYINSVDGFGGDQNFMAKFGLEIRDQVHFTVAQRVFLDEINTAEKVPLPRPREGDLIYFPINNKCFQIKFVNNKPVFYPLGALQVFEMTCELFEYSSEEFSTGIPEIDILQKNFSENILDYSLMTEDGYFLRDEDEDYIVVDRFDAARIDITDDAVQIQKESNIYLDFSEHDPFSEGGVY